MTVKLQQSASFPNQPQVDKKLNWIFVLPYPFDEKTLKDVPYLQTIRKRRQRIKSKTQDSSPVVLDLPNDIIVRHIGNHGFKFRIFTKEMFPDKSTIISLIDLILSINTFFHAFIQ